MITGRTLGLQIIGLKGWQLVQERKSVWSRCARDKTMEKVMFITWCLNYYFIRWNFCDVILLCCAPYRRVLCKHAHIYTQQAIQVSKITPELVWECQYTSCSVQKELGAATLGICGIQDNENAEALAKER